MKSLSAVFVLAFLCTCISKEKIHKVEEPRNIIFILSDDHAYQAISAYDYKLIKTPYIDRLANEGMLLKYL